MQGQCASEQMKQGWVVRFVMFLVVVARWGKKEGGDGLTVQVVLCTGQAVNLGTLGEPLFRLALCDRSVSLFERHGNLLCVLYVV